MALSKVTQSKAKLVFFVLFPFGASFIFSREWRSQQNKHLASSVRSKSLSSCLTVLETSTNWCLRPHFPSVHSSISLFIPQVSNLFVFILKFVFNWRIIALQYCAGFSHVSTRISHWYTYVPSHLPLHPTSRGCQRAPALSSLHHTANFHWLSNFMYGIVYVSMLLSQLVPPSPYLPEYTSLFSLSVSLNIGVSAICRLFF